MEEVKKKIDLKDYKYKDNYERFMKENDPTVCVTGEFDITNIYRLSKKGHKINCLLCYALLKAAQETNEFHYSIQEDGLYYYKNMKVNAVVNGSDGLVYYADYKYCSNYEEFEKEYLRVNEYCYNNCTSYFEDIGSVIATSAVIQFPFESITLGVSKTFWDNFVMWSAYKKKLFSVKLNITMRFHHATIMGQDAAKLFNNLQKQFNNLKLK